MKSRRRKTPDRHPRRRYLHALVAAALVVLWVAGCHRRQGSGSATTSAARQPPATATASARSPFTTAAARPKDVTLTIDGSPVAFPPVYLAASDTGAGVAVELTTPTADEESGNSLNFDFTLSDADDPARLTGAAWHFYSDDPDRADTLNGLFLYGRAAALEPRDVTITFVEPDAGGATTIELEGQFRLFDPADSETAQKTVAVHGRFAVVK